ncbi:MAG: helicase-related protein [Anaerolineales bacterium]
MTTFITNDPNKNLKDRLATLISHSARLKFLVGFFYFSGWRELYHALQNHPDLHLQILVGLEVDTLLGNTIETTRSQPNATANEHLETFYTSLRTALTDETLDTPDFYEQITFFSRLLETNRLQIRKTLEPNHAKLYLFCLNPSAQALTGKPGRLITGSSNLTRAGLYSQHEFNVEIGDYGWQEAETYFDTLWQNALPITEDPQRKTRLLTTLQNNTHAASITPFEAYTLVLKAYLDLMQQRSLPHSLIQRMKARGYTPYRYQLDAVQQALTIVHAYHGVIIADVVGLGKSVIAAMLGHALGGRGIILCPPGLIGDKNAQSGWRKYQHDFDLHGWEIRSSGNLPEALTYLQTQGQDIQTVILDEAHRFRNEDTATYESLSAICRGRRVILLTATPFNNAPNDIFALLKLFIVPGKSKITLDENLESRFARYNADFQRTAYILRYHNSSGERLTRAQRHYAELFDDAPPPIDLARVRQRASQVARAIRAALEPVTIRRNRLDLRNDPLYATEVTQLSQIEDPHERFYNLTPEQLAFYERILTQEFGENGKFTGAIYQPFRYENSRALQTQSLDEASNSLYQQQRNLYEFMRRLLVKRFESSFGAFARTIQNFERIHQRVLTFIQNSGGKYILDRALIEKIYNSDPDDIEQALQAFEDSLNQKTTRRRSERIYTIANFDDSAGFLSDIQNDLDQMTRLRLEINDLQLVARDPKAQNAVCVLRAILESPPAPGEPPRKAILFSEYLDTIRHLRPLLEAAFPEQVLTVEGSLSAALTRDLLQNFDASHPQQTDQYRILLTSDKLAEGFNLNRAGAIINYDIPWNPTRVIQRVGRINRIGRKVFESLQIYNFFPTAPGADVIKSREIATEKMALIHATLGEDAKIFDPSETPAPAELFKRLNRNPEDEETESLLTRVRRIYQSIQNEHPEIIQRIANFPARVKTAKHAEQNELIVFRRKGLALFIHSANPQQEPLEVNALLFEDALPRIQAEPETARQDLSPQFWRAYQAIQTHRETIRIPKSDIALETKALNNLQSALRLPALAEERAFIQSLLRDLRDYKTLPKATLRRLSSVPLDNPSARAVQNFRAELDQIRLMFGEDQQSPLTERLQDLKSEVIIAIENQQA